MPNNRVQINLIRLLKAQCVCILNIKTAAELIKTL